MRVVRMKRRAQILAGSTPPKSYSGELNAPRFGGPNNDADVEW